MSDLFTALEDQKRQQLRKLGWYDVSHHWPGGRYWQSPAGPTYSEEEAFIWLEHKEKEKTS